MEHGVNTDGEGDREKGARKAGFLGELSGVVKIFYDF
jgi:hypothetical protein